MKTGVSKVASHMIALAAAWTNHRAVTSNCTVVQFGYNSRACLWWQFIVGHPSSCVA